VNRDVHSCILHNAILAAIFGFGSVNRKPVNRLTENIPTYNPESQTFRDRELPGPDVVRAEPNVGFVIFRLIIQICFVNLVHIIQFTDDTKMTKRWLTGLIDGINKHNFNSLDLQ